MSSTNDQENDPGSYPHPRHASPEAEEVFHEYIRGEAQKLAGVIDYRAIQSQNGGRVPRQTAEDVRRAIADHVGARQGRVAPQNRAALEKIFFTVALIGLPVMANFFWHSLWQAAIFTVLIVIGVVSLVLTWRGRRDDVEPRNGDHR